MSKTEEFNEKLKEARLRFQQSAVWKHYKGGIYQIVNFSIDTDNTEVRVEYRRVDGPGYDQQVESDIHFSRPSAEWFDDVEGQPRFVPVKQVADAEVREWMELDAAQ